MTDDRFIDLDELVLLCNREHGRQHIAEAVACYRAGAFRACIVAAWIAVVFDFVGKLQQLELAGDANGKRRRDEYEQARSSGDVRACLEFERRLLSLARDEFELITSIECKDLERLAEDRHRCAHPSMNASEEVYSPSAETARAHLRNAVVHFLRHPPVQGKAALARVMTDIESAYFPTTTQDAVTQLASGPLIRPRASLVRNLVVALVKTLLRETLDPSVFRRRVAALNGTRQLHKEITEDVLEQLVTPLVKELEDDQLPNVVQFLRHVPDTWCFCHESVCKTMARVVEQLPESSLNLHLTAALDVDPLRAFGLKRLKTATGAELSALVEAGPRPEYTDLVIDVYAHATDEKAASVFGSRMVIPMAPLIEKSHFETVLASISSNESVKASSTLGAVLRSIRDAGRIDRTEFDSLLKTNGLDVTFGWLLDDSQENGDTPNQETH